MLINKYMFSGIYKSTNNYYSINHAYELPLPRGGYCGDQKNYRTKPNPTVHLSSNELHEPFLSNTVGPVNNLFNRLQQSTQPKETNLPDSHIKSGFSLHEYLDYYTTAPAGAANPSSSQPVIYPTKPTRPGQSEYYTTAPAGAANPSSSQPVIYPTKPTRPGQSEYYTTAPAGAANPSSSQPVIYPTKPTRPGQSEYYTTAPAGAANPSSSQPVIYPTKPTRPGQSEYYTTAPAGAANPSSSQPVIYPTKPTRPGQSEYYEKLENERCLSCGDIPNNKITDTDAKYYCTKPYYVCGLSNPFFEK